MHSLNKSNRQSEKLRNGMRSSQVRSGTTTAVRSNPRRCKKGCHLWNFSSCSKFSRLAGTHLTRELGYKGRTDENLTLTTLHHTCIVPSPSNNNEDVQRHWHGVAKRRSFLRSIGIAGTGLSASVVLGSESHAQASRRSTVKLPKGDAALSRLSAAVELIEADPVQARESERRLEPAIQAFGRSPDRWL